MALEELTNPPYRGYINDALSLHQGNVQLKAYVCNIGGRDGATEWDPANPLSFHQVAEQLAAVLEGGLHDGVPHFAAVFPHVTSVYRWGDPRYGQRETNLHKVVLMDTSTFKVKESAAHVEVGCPVENYLIGVESGLWSKAESVPEYMSLYAMQHEVTPLEALIVAKPNKLRDFLIANGLSGTRADRL